MKKIIPYILILVVTIGFFIPGIVARAGETPLGTCTIQDSAEGPSIPTDYKNKTEEECRALKPTLGTWKWVLNTTQTPASIEPLGTCRVWSFAGNLTTTRTLKTNCTWNALTQRGEWIPDKTFSPVTLTGGSTDVNTDTRYFPLAPLPGLGAEGCKDASGKIVNGPDGKPIPCIDTTTECAFGKYMNIVIKLIIGLIAVGAVVMIVLGGMQYMTSELISSKEAGKERIRNALLGLIIALGAYALLFTINPQLLDTCLDKLPQATIVINDEPETGIQGKTITVDGVTFTACDTTQMENMTLFGKSVTVNKAIVNNLKRIDAKWNAMPVATRYKINTIGGYECRPVTNKPGYWSSHAYGLALDINEATNPYGPTLKTDMLDHLDDFVGLFIVEGWGWGGGWLSKKDAMHFSKIPREELGNSILK